MALSISSANHVLYDAHNQCTIGRLMTCVFGNIR